MCPLAPYDTLCLWTKYQIHPFHHISSVFTGPKKKQKSNLLGCPHCKRLCWDWFGAIVAQHVVKLFRITVLLYGRIFPGRKLLSFNMDATVRCYFLRWGIRENCHPTHRWNPSIFQGPACCLLRGFPHACNPHMKPKNGHLKLQSYIQTLTQISYICKNCIDVQARTGRNIYIYNYIYICIYIYVYIYILCIYICVYIYVCIYIYICIYIYMIIYVYMCVFAYELHMMIDMAPNYNWWRLLNMICSAILEWSPFHRNHHAYTSGSTNTWPTWKWKPLRYQQHPENTCYIIYIYIYHYISSEQFTLPYPEKLETNSRRTHETPDPSRPESAPEISPRRSSSLHG